MHAGSSGRESYARPRGRSNPRSRTCRPPGRGRRQLRPAIENENAEIVQYPGRDSNSYITLVMGDFESPASTDSATRARIQI